jgi:hypothetical protein
MVNADGCRFGKSGGFMVALTGALTAQLADNTEVYTDDLVREINDSIRPPQPIRGDTVYIRAMYIVSDQINSQGGRFDEEGLERLVELLVDSPVMVGHKRSSLPVARNFKAVKLSSDDRVWVKTWFYWMKDAAGAGDLLRNIDGGIYKECSISFLFRLPECSICGKDIRGCPHIPFQEYAREDGSREITFFYYRDIERVLETSLVFRGAIPDTRITDDLSGSQILDRTAAAALFAKPEEEPSSETLSPFYNDAPLVLETADSYAEPLEANYSALFPHQPGLPLSIAIREGKVVIDAGHHLTKSAEKRVRDLLGPFADHDLFLDALLYAHRGNDRLSAAALLHLMESHKNGHRLHLRLCDLRRRGEESLAVLPWSKRREMLEAIFSRDLPDGLELLRPKATDSAEIRTILNAGTTFKFGTELVGENEGDKNLVRTLVCGRALVPARVEAIESRGQNGKRLTLHTAHQELDNSAVTVRDTSGLSVGSIILVMAGRRGSGKLVPVFHDLCPGITDLEQFHVGTEDHEAKFLYLHQDDMSLQLLFRIDNTWRKVTVYHFSKQLMNRGRRFVADMGRLPDYLPLYRGFDRLPLRTVTASGKLVRLILEKGKQHIGTDTIWLRPILLDSRERYLCCGEKTIDD